MHFCQKCGKEVATKTGEVKESLNVFGKEFIEITAYVLVCAECGNPLYPEQITEANRVRACNEYRRRHNLLMPLDIREIRMRHGIGYSEFAKLVGCTIEDIQRYEDGSLPSDEVDQKLRDLNRGCY